MDIARAETPSALRQVVAGVVLLAAVAVIALVGSLATIDNVEGWYAGAQKAPWNPPNGVFGPVWSVLYAGIAVAGFLVWRAGFAGRGAPNTARAWLTVYIVQLALNSAWTPAFFGGYPLLGEAAWWLAAVIILLLLVVVVWLAVMAWRRSRVASIVMAVYALWVAFASTLNIAIIALN